MLKIDVFNHVLPERFLKALPTASSYVPNISKKDSAKSGGSGLLADRLALHDLDTRFRIMDRFDGYVQIICMAEPPVEDAGDGSSAVELARIANDEMAELVRENPDRFVAAVACLPLNDMDAALKEAERAITQLNFRGVQVFTHVNGAMLDTPRFKPLFELMASYDLPLWIHPVDPLIMSLSLDGLPAEIQYWVNHFPMGSFIWPYETSLAMMGLVNAGTFVDFPDLKFITHHCGGLVPFFEKRMKRVAHPEHLRKFYNDTAVYGNTSSLMCGHAFFGAERLLFGTDMPLGATQGGGFGYTLDTVRSIEQMSIPEEEKAMIFEGNIRKILRLTV